MMTCALSFPSRMGYTCETCLILPNLITMATEATLMVSAGAPSRPCASELARQFRAFQRETQGLSFWAHTAVRA